MNNNVRRIGLVVPPGNVAMERELPNYLPPGIVINTNRLSRSTAQVTPESLLAMNASLERAANDLSMCYPQPEAILYGCTSGGFILGAEQEATWAAEVSAICGIHIITTTAAVVAGLRAVDAKRIYVVTPYTDEVNKHVVRFLEESGISVTGYDSFRRSDTRDVANITTQAVAELLLQHTDEVSRCDAALLSCTNMLTMDQIEYLEQVLEKPILTSNQCSLWATLKYMDAKAGKSAPGRLFDGMRED